MTTDHNLTGSEANPAPGSLPFLADTPELLRVRVLPSEFARIVGVSKQSVSRWVRAGKVTLTFDGRIDVQRGVQQVLRNTDPGQLRARVLRQAVEDVRQLRDTVANVETREAALRAQLEEAQRQAAHWERGFDRYGRAEEHLARLLLQGARRLRAMPPAAWPAALDAMRVAAWDASAEEAGAPARPSTSGTPQPSIVGERAGGPVMLPAGDHGAEH